MTKTDGLLLVDKPSGPTSHTVVSQVRRLAGTRKVGHAGTLDPMATGLLVLGINRATRLLTYLVGADKTYVATIRLGQGTSTDDADGELTTSVGITWSEDPDQGRLDVPTSAVHTAELDKSIASLRGSIQQVPSTVSAIKIDGQRAYARVRAGEEVVLQARPVTIHQFTLDQIRPTMAGDTPVLDLDVLITCSSGTYIRALARDLGAALGVDGHLTSLRRTHVGPFSVTNAAQLNDAPSEAPEFLDQPAFLPLAEAFEAAFPLRQLDESEARALSYGQAITSSGNDDVIGALDPDGRAIALLQDRGGQARPVLVVAPA